MTPPQRYVPWIVVAALVVVTGRAAVAVRQATPSVTATRIMLGWAGDPATSQAVTWRTSGPIATPQAQIAVAGQGAEDGRKAALVAARSTRVELPGRRAAFHHLARFDGLAPATSYVYRVGDGTTWSAWARFVTASREPAPFQFIYLGDAQTGLDTVWPRVVRAAAARAPQARFIVDAGDLLEEGYDDTLWGRWVAAQEGIANGRPHVPVPGNNDEHRAPGTRHAGKVMEVSSLWRAHFALPANGPTDLPELAGQYYVLDYQGVRLVALDANPFANDDYVGAERPRVQRAVLAWLRAVLAKNPSRWTIVVQHQPLHGVIKGHDFPAMRKALGAVYDQYHVDLVLQGHDHAYGRTGKLNAGRPVAPSEAGTIYAVSVSGQKLADITQKRKGLMARQFSGVQSYQVIGVDSERLTYESYAADGRQMDGFDLVKTARGTTYVDRSPGLQGK